MERIINGRRYNTETAQEIGSYWNELGPRDFNRIEETLYITARGNFFLAGSGGCMSKYAVAVGNDTSGSERITPLSRQEAFEWCQEFLSDPAEYQEYFSDLIKDA